MIDWSSIVSKSSALAALARIGMQGQGAPQEREQQSPRPQRFLSVSEAADVFQVDPMTVYRAIRAGEFPAVKLRGRYLVPAKAIEEMIDAAVTTGSVVDVAEWAAESAAS
jgi:excisionase family DNA binding protein